MVGLLVHVEGETEEAFVNEVLAPHLFNHGFTRVSARLLGNARQRTQRGGIRRWDSVRRDIVRHLSEDRSCIATTMVDYYGLPSAGHGAWPGREQAIRLPFQQKSEAVNRAILLDIVDAMGPDFDVSRLVPFVVMHEFEGLLFSDCEAFANGMGNLRIAENLQAIRDRFETPEHINDSPTTAPSKRVKREMPNYQKILHGNLAALGIGLQRIRLSCPVFANWLDRLEQTAAHISSAPSTIGT